MWQAKLEAVQVNSKQWGISLDDRDTSTAQGTQAPPPAKLELPRAKLEAETVNTKQWGLVPGAAEQEAAIRKAKELAKAAAAKKPQVGAGTVRLGTQTGLGKTIGTQPVPVKGKRLGTTRVGETQPASKARAPAAKRTDAGGAGAATAAAAEPSDPLLAMIEKAGKKPWMSEAGGRAITNAEVVYCKLQAQIASYNLPHSRARGTREPLPPPLLLLCRHHQCALLRLSEPCCLLHAPAHLTLRRGWSGRGKGVPSSCPDSAWLWRRRWLWLPRRCPSLRMSS